MEIRKAQRSESYTIARLYQMAADGVADYVWRKIDPDNPDILEVGAQRYAREGVSFSYENCDMLVEDDTTLGMIMAFPMRVDPEYTETDEILRPYAILEEDNSLYISGVAVFPEYRNRRLGRRLMQFAEDKARELDLNKLSLIVFEDNPAKRLYEALGYREVMREAVVDHPLIVHSGYAVLMVKSLLSGNDALRCD